jgi:CubicO group peptidase (beta-lactamase class C family)
MKKVVYLLSFFVSIAFSNAQNMYFPPKLDNNWETISPASLNWDTSKIEALYSYLDSENSKAFIVLYNGKIVLEKYFDTFTKDSTWYWASAGKSLTAFLIGKAQEDKILSINDKSSKYLGVGWTSCPKEKEDLITIKHQITMTSGLNDKVEDNHCLEDTCLQYLADAGTRWAYHNAAYTLLEKVITTASNTSINVYTQQKIKNQTGMTGAWFTLDNDNVFFSKARSMARFGLLVQNDCIWDGDTLLADKEYIKQMSSTSQNLNKSYGYLWWLNGKSSYMMPGLQTQIPGSLAPNAPEDMFAALGKNGQIINISKSKGLVLVRMGEEPGNLVEVTPQLSNKIWQFLNPVINKSSEIENSDDLQADDIHNQLFFYPNPANETITISNSSTLQGNSNLSIYDVLGNEISNFDIKNEQTIDISQLAKGIYTIKLGSKISKLIKK